MAEATAIPATKTITWLFIVSPRSSACANAHRVTRLVAHCVPYSAAASRSGRPDCGVMVSTAILRILLANELGGGLGHLAILQPLIGAFDALGCDTKLAVPRLARRELAGRDAALEIVTAAEVPPPSHAARHGAFCTFADGLSDAGFSDERYVLRKVRAWREVLARTQPALVVINHAPFLHLAAIGSVAVTWVGTGFEIPPSRGSFPALPGRGAASRATEQVLPAVRSAQRELGMPPAETLEQLFPARMHHIVTIPELDPYSEYRAQACAGPLRIIDTVPSAAADKVFAYLSAESANRAAIVGGLIDAKVGAIVVVRGRGGLRDAGERFGDVELTSRAIAIEDALRECRLLVHHGGMSMTQEGLMAGIPQLVLPRFDEQQLNGRAVERLGAGISRANPSAAWVARMVRTMLDDDSLAARCASVARTLRARFPYGSARSVATRCLEDARS
jgi:UDP:flavonoid glycosyltransferase YjiC (YdhE family)